MRLVAIVSATILLVTGSAYGQAPPAAPDNVLAETLFREGRALLEKGETEKACLKLGDSYRLDPRLGTLMNLAACHEMEGKVATAWAEFLEASRIARARGGAEGKKYEETAKSRAAELEPKMPHVVLSFDEQADDLAIAIDDREVPRAAWSTRIPIDPGAHVLEARRPDRAAFRAPFDVAASGETTIRIPVLEELPGTTTTTPTPAGGEGSRFERPLFWIAAGVSVVAAGVGTVFGIRAMDAKSDRDAACDAVGCPPQGIADQDRAFADATASTVSFVVSGVAAAAAVVVLAWPKTPAANAARVLTPAGLRF